MEVLRDPRLVKGIEEFNQRLFFECHETLEEIWLEDRGEDRLFYQGLIQVAAGYYKLEQGVLIGAIKLWQRGLEKLEAYPAIHLGVDVGSMIVTTRKNLATAESAREGAETAPQLGMPQISFAPGVDAG
jgi:predicted metal-dependent hydrolase